MCVLCLLGDWPIFGRQTMDNGLYFSILGSSGSEYAS